MFEINIAGIHECDSQHEGVNFRESVADWKLKPEKLPYLKIIYHIFNALYKNLFGKSRSLIVSFVGQKFSQVF